MNTTLSEVKNNWFIIVFIGSLIVGWTTFNARLTQAENETQTLEDSLVRITESYNQINARLIKIETTTDFIKQNIK